MEFFANIALREMIFIAVFTHIHSINIVSVVAGKTIATFRTPYTIVAV
jgi:hypothetical protein